MTVQEAVKKYNLENFHKYYVDKSGKSMDLMPLDELKNLEVAEVCINLENMKAFITLYIKPPMKTKDEIIEYLNINPEYFYIDKLLKSAEQVEQKYRQEIAAKTVGYGLECDFDSDFDLLEDMTKVDNLEEIERINGIAVYRINY